MLFCGVEQRRISSALLGRNDTVVASSSDPSSMIENILQLLPEYKPYRGCFGKFSQRAILATGETGGVSSLREPNIRFTWFNELSFEDMLKRAATLPPRSAIIFTTLSVDAAGISHEELKSFLRLHAVANAPIFGQSDINFGKGLVGGSLVELQATAERSASVALRILPPVRRPAISRRHPRCERPPPNMTGANWCAGTSAKAGCRPGVRYFFATRACGVSTVCR